MTSTNDESTSWSVGDILSRPHRIDLVWFLLPVALALAGFGILPLRSWDYWWHITMGRLINYWGAVPAENHFLYTMAADAGSYDQPWLSQLVLYGLHFNGSVYLPLVVRNLAAGAGVAWLSWMAMKRSDSVTAGSLATLAGLPFLFAFIELRPTLFAWPLFCLLVGLGYAIYERRLSRGWLLAFPVVATLWANLHGSFLLAAVLAGLFMVAAAARERPSPGHFDWHVPGSWGAAAFGSVLTPLLNPRGLEIYRYVYGQFTNDVVGTTVTEWLPTTPTNPGGVGAYFYVALLVAGGLLIWRRRETDFIDRLLFATFALFAVAYARGLLWFGFVLPFTLAPSLEPLSRDPDDRPEAHPVMQRVHTFLALGFIFLAVALQPSWQWRTDWTADSELFDVRSRAPMKGVVQETVPFEATEVLGRYTKPPRMFQDDRFAGFLLYHLTDEDPQQLVFVDQRIELPSDRIWNLYYHVNDEPGVWKGVFHQYNIKAAVLSHDRQQKLVDRLKEASEWSQAMGTDNWSFFLKANPPNGKAER